MNTITKLFKSQYDAKTNETMSLEEYLERCKIDKGCYATAAERMLKAIGDPKIVDTSNDSSLSRIFANRKIKIYPAFSEFYGLEDVVENIVGHFKHAAQNLEESKQILYLLGPVGGGKSSLADCIKKLMEKEPIYVLATDNEISPMFESPLGLFDINLHGDMLENEFNIPRRYLKIINSPWAQKRLKEFNGDVSKFKVVKMYPSILNQIAISKAEPGDENNQDISTLVGSVNINKLQKLGEDDPDAYGYTGSLNIATQGIMEFVEMFKAPIKMLNPLLTATQDGSYNGTRRFGSMPFQGLIISHSNESEWETFKNDRRNEAFLDRVNLVYVPYCLRYNKEIQIYEKLLKNSELAEAPVAPKTLELMAKFSVLTRIHHPENSDPYPKMLTYAGEYIKEEYPKAKTYQEYKDTAGIREGMEGLSTRFAYKVLSKTFNHDADEIAANPIHLMYNLEKQIKHECFDEEKEANYIKLIDQLKRTYANFLIDELQKAYLESYQEYGQNLFNNYIEYADLWIQNMDYRDPNTGTMMNRDALNKELEKIEKPAGIANPKDFRNEIVNYALRARAENGGKEILWTSYEKLRRVIEKRMFNNTEEMLPIISFGKKRSSDEETKHANFVTRMVERGYTQKQVQLLVSWYTHYNKSN